MEPPAAPHFAELAREGRVLVQLLRCAALLGGRTRREQNVALGTQDGDQVDLRANRHSEGHKGGVCGVCVFYTGG